MTATSSGECPHCGERMESVTAFDRHLADRHGLRMPDDPSPPRPPQPSPRAGTSLTDLVAGVLSVIMWVGIAAFVILLYLGAIPLQFLVILSVVGALFGLYLWYRMRVG